MKEFFDIMDDARIGLLENSLFLTICLLPCPVLVSKTMCCWAMKILQVKYSCRLSAFYRVRQRALSAVSGRAGYSGDGLLLGCVSEKKVVALRRASLVMDFRPGIYRYEVFASACCGFGCAWNS
jgi:hypothetical protein